MSEINQNYVITILGCGDSAGVPRAGGDWGGCNPDNPKNRRTRPSLLVQSITGNLVVDTGPDFHEQMTREKILDLSAVLYTHGHSDHINGMDDLRSYHRRSRKRLPVYADAPTRDELDQRFHYIFEQKSPYYPKVADLCLMDDNDFGLPHHAGDITFIPFLQKHGEHGRSIGYRFDKVGYSTDMSDLDEAAINVLQGIKVWIADGADFHRPERIVHSNLEILLHLNKKIGAEKVFLIHMGNALDYDFVGERCPDGFFPAYDGLKIKSDGTIL